MRPGSFVLGWLVFWLPFPDFGANVAHIRRIAHALQFKIKSRQGRMQPQATLVMPEPLPSLRDFEALGAGSRLVNQPWMCFLAAIVSPQTRFFLAFIALPMLTLVWCVASSGIVEFG